MAISGVSFFKKKDSAENTAQTELKSIQSLKKESDSNAVDQDADKKPKQGEPGVCCGSCS